ncbi:hypothetical protein WJX72_004436 [[Myrmecia] bisecta]|uniref:Adenosylmethionine decarboxylase n=1 Tax=[Myrmecia] bisecta TaxID=41462 RepID=A0AAW1PYA1_9CHLO
MVQASDVFVSPVFEGSEKRLEVDFQATAATPPSGLRAIARAQWDSLLETAACCIVSARSNAYFDAYVLSESSLFVYPTKAVLKTCGTTKLLAAVPCLLDLAAGLQMTVARCKYSRASYLFPEYQPAPYTDFGAETEILREHFGGLAGGCSSYVLGDALNGLQWHVFVATADQPGSLQQPAQQPTYTLEVCMTDLCPFKAAQFARGPNFVSSAATTASSGISALLPGAQIDDYVFEPCGYSMNGMEGAAFSTIHITPEAGFSYASLELCGYAADGVDVAGVVAKVADIFCPGQLTVSMSVDVNQPYCQWGSSLGLPEGYSFTGSTCQYFNCSGRTAFFNLARGKDADVAPGSPSTVLRQTPSLFSVASAEDVDSDADMSDNKSTASEGDGKNPKPSSSRASEADLEMADTRSAASENTAAAAAAGQASLAGPASAAQLAVKSVPAVLAAFNAMPLAAGDAATLDSYMQRLIAQRGLEDPLYLVDLGALRRLFDAWVAAMPRVQPFYAVKCNPNPAMIALLAAMGAGFDCASEMEVDQVLSHGVAPDDIVYANPCKVPRAIRHAAAKGVNLTTFDTESELQKLAAWHPATSALLRIKADDPNARCQLGNKYGAQPGDCHALLERAKELGVRVTGVSFHVGSGATNPDAFREAIELARRVFDDGLALGFDMQLLDIGGGFCVSHQPEATVDLGAVPAAVNAALEKDFPADTGVRVIAEPGRYFAETAATFACMVYGTRTQTDSDGRLQHDYWITDGLYGSMNCRRGELFNSTVFGPTCDGLDTVLRDYQLPKMANGDWLVFPSMGAYTLAGASNFNGINSTDVNVFYVCSERSA